MENIWQIKDTPDVPKDLRPILEGHLKRVEHLLPRWINSVRVKSIPVPGEGNQDRAATIMIQDEYRCAEISINPLWWDMDDEGRHRTLVHELCHLPFAQIYEIARSVIENCLEDAAANVMKDQLRRADESATEDTAQMILRAEGLKCSHLA